MSRSTASTTPHEKSDATYSTENAPLLSNASRPTSITPSYLSAEKAGSLRPDSVASSYRTPNPQSSARQNANTSNLSAIAELDEVQKSEKRTASDKFLKSIATKNVSAAKRLLQAKKADPNRELYALRELSSTFALVEHIAVSFRRILFRRNPFANRHDGLGDLPLWRATLIGDRDMVELLLEYGADPNVYIGRETIIDKALKSRRIAIARALLNAGAKTDLSSHLRLAIEVRDKPRIKLLLDCGADIYIAVCSRKDLFQIITESDFRCAEILLVAGADSKVEEEGEEKEGGNELDNVFSATQFADALAAAVRAGFANVARFLLRRGADVKTHGIMGRVRHHTLPEAGDLEFLVPDNSRRALNPAHDSQFTLLMSAVQGQNPEVTSVLLEYGVDVNAQTRSGCTALMFAALNLPKGAEHAKLLFKHHARLDVTDDGGRNALFYVAAIHPYIQSGPDPYGHSGPYPVEMLQKLTWHQTIYVPSYTKLLLASGADSNAKAHTGESVLAYAIRKGAFWMVNILLANGADVNAKDKDGNTLLICLMKQAWPWIQDADEACEAAGSLLSHGADVNAKDNDGCTALIYAAKPKVFHGILTYWPEKRAFTRIEYLLKKGANIDAQDSRKMTALMYAVESNYEDITRLLLGCCADVKITAEDGKGALAQATWMSFSQTESQDNNLLQILLEHEGLPKEKTSWITLDTLEPFVRSEFSESEWEAMKKVELRRIEDIDLATEERLRQLPTNRRV